MKCCVDFKYSRAIIFISTSKMFVKDLMLSGIVLYCDNNLISDMVMMSLELFFTRGSEAAILTTFVSIGYRRVLNHRE